MTELANLRVATPEASASSLEHVEVLYGIDVGYLVSRGQSRYQADINDEYLLEVLDAAGEFDGPADPLPLTIHVTGYPEAVHTSGSVGFTGSREGGIERRHVSLPILTAADIGAPTLTKQGEVKRSTDPRAHEIDLLRKAVLLGRGLEASNKRGVRDFDSEKVSRDCANVMAYAGAVCFTGTVGGAVEHLAIPSSTASLIFGLALSGFMAVKLRASLLDSFRKAKDNYEDQNFFEKREIELGHDYAKSVARRAAETGRVINLTPM
jgi:hypothetical protein